MKFFSGKIANIHQRELKELDNTEFNNFMSRIGIVGRRIPKEYARIGVLDANDITQECYLLFLTAWNRIDWDWIESLPEDEREPSIWTFLKKTVEKSIKRNINNYRNGVRIPEYKLAEDMEKTPYEVLFPTFFKSEFAKAAADVGSTAWDTELLAMGLEDAMDGILSFKEKDILKRFYGIDQDKESMQQIAVYYKTSGSYIAKAKHKAISKLRKHPETKKIIEKYFKI